MNLLGHLKIRTKLASMVVLAAPHRFSQLSRLSASLSQNRMIEDRVRADAHGRST